MNAINIVLHNPMALVLMAFVTGIASIRVPSYLKGRIRLRRLWYARGNMEGHTSVVIPRLLSPLRANLGKAAHVAYRMLSPYLLVAIGFRGGYEVSVNGLVLG